MNTRRRMEWAAALVVTQVADLASTYWALSNGAHETNPVVNWLGFPLAAAVKAVVVGGILVGSAKANPSAFDKCLQFVVVLYLAIIALNLKAAVGG